MRRRRAGGRQPHCPPLSGSPQERLAAFEALGRSSRRHGRGTAFGAETWDVTDDVVRRPGVPARQGPLRVAFAAADAGPRGLGGFLRAYVGQLPRSGHAALTALALAGGLITEAMAARGVAAVAGIDAATLNAASALARDRHSPGHAARLGNAVRSLGAFLHDHGMTRAPLVGARRAPAPAEDRDRAGDAFAERSRRSLPSAGFLEALADASRLAAAPAEIIVTRVATVLMSACGRVNEALALDEEPEVERALGGVGYLGLRWHASKGAEDGVKWVVPEMAPAVRDACADLRRATEEGRRIKRSYDADPASLYLPPELSHLRGKAELTPEECGALLGRRPGPGLDARLAALGDVSFAGLEAHLLRELPARMRDAGGPETHPLLLVPLGLFDGARRPPCPCMFEAVAYRHVADALGGRGGGGGPLFRRLGLDPEGAIAGRTHQFRHWLVTVALRGGLSPAEVAEWAGHASQREGRAYDHRTAAEMRALVRRASEAGRRPAGLLAGSQEASRNTGRASE